MIKTFSNSVTLRTKAGLRSAVFFGVYEPFGEWAAVQSAEHARIISLFFADFEGNSDCLSVTPQTSRPMAGVAPITWCTFCGFGSALDADGKNQSSYTEARTQTQTHTSCIRRTVRWSRRSIRQVPEQAAGGYRPAASGNNASLSQLPCPRRFRSPQNHSHTQNK